MNTKMTEILGIRYPIMQGGMNAASSPELAAAVSDAGGLGTINATQYFSEEELRQAIREIKGLTSKPFAVNVSMVPDHSEYEMTDAYMKVIVEENVPVVETAGRNPEAYVPMLHENGVKIVHKTTAVRYALKAQKAGVDMVTLMGFESAGHPGMNDVALSALIPNAVDQLDIPVLVSGGTADGRGLVAALAWGGAGVVMGTRFVASEECPVHPAIKERVVAAKEYDSMIIQRSIRNAFRVLKTEFAYHVLGAEQEYRSVKELMPLISGKRQRSYFEKGEVENGLFSVGQTIGAIHDIKPAGQIVTDIVQEAKQIIESLYRKQ